ncbi:hypothetical protein CO641_14045 [Lysobacteraceae bacterium NML91-0213]|nr:hypothetical protein CO641_14045 [Xanthomonadaceae bacterium NML91-0213]
MTVISYAQNFEDVMLWRALRHIENGFYIDVGAQSPDVDSVTRLFYERGWRGINVEPSEQWYRALLERRPRDVNLNVAAGRASGEIDLHEFGGTGLSTAVDAYASSHEKSGFRREVVQVKVRTLQSICEEYHVAPVHFLKIDVEGYEGDVLAGVDFSIVRPWIVVVEATLPNTQIPSYEDWESILSNSDYDFVYFDGLNRYYVAAERRSLSESFLAPPNVFDDFSLNGDASNPFSRHLVTRIQSLEADHAEAVARMAEADAELTRAQGDLARAADELATCRGRVDDLVQSSERLRSQWDDAKYELAIARKRLAADTRSLMSKDERISVLEGKLDSISAGWDVAVSDALVRFGEVIDERIASLNGTSGTAEQQHVSIMDGVARLEALVADKLAAAERHLEQSNQQSRELSREFSVVGAEISSLVTDGLAKFETLMADRAVSAEARADQAVIQAQSLSRELAEVREQLAASLNNAHVWYLRHGEALEAIQTLEARLAEVLESNHGWFVKASAHERTLRQIEGSRSWRLTAPLRGLRRGTARALKAVFKPPLLCAIRVLRRYPRAWAFASRRVKSYPRLFSRLKGSALAAGVVPQPAYATNAEARPMPVPVAPGRQDVSAYQLRILSRIRTGG